MTVAELFAQLQVAMAAGQGSIDVVVRAEDDGGSDYCGTVGTAEVEVGEDGTPFFAIDCGPDESDDEFVEEGAGEAGEEEADESEEGDEADEDPKPS